MTEELARMITWKYYLAFGGIALGVLITVIYVFWIIFYEIRQRIRNKKRLKIRRQK